MLAELVVEEEPLYMELEMALAEAYHTLVLVGEGEVEGEVAWHILPSNELKEVGILGNHGSHECQ
jgi:hypothetical protein